MSKTSQNISKSGILLYRLRSYLKAPATQVWNFTPEEEKNLESHLLRQIEAMGLHRDIKHLRWEPSGTKQYCSTRPWESYDYQVANREFGKVGRNIQACTDAYLYNHKQYEELKELRRSKLFNINPKEEVAIGHSYCSSKDNFKRRQGRIIATIRALDYSVFKLGQIARMQNIE